MENKKRKGLIALVAVLGIVLIATGATYAWFSYSGQGTRLNTISSGSITFRYEEKSQGLRLTEVLPMTDEQGMAQNQYFDFEITSKTNTATEIPYYITVRRTATSDANLDSHIKLYLTKVGDNNQETAVEIISGETLATFSQLGTYTNSKITIPASERALFNDIVPSNSANYREKYRLRMWIDENTNFIVQTPTEAYCEDNSTNQPVAEIDSVTATAANCVGQNYTWHPADVQSTYPYQNSTYSLKVNVYGEGSAIGDSRLAPGLYDSNGDLVTSWDDLISNGDITVNDNVLTDSNRNLVGNLVIKRGITGIETVAFSFSTITGVDIPSTVTSIDYSFPGAHLTSVVVEEGNPVYDSRDNCNAIIETATNTLVYGSGSTVIPSTVTTIGSRAFAYNPVLTSITIPNTVTTLGDGAFEQNENLESVTLSGSITRIEGGTFNGCSKLTSITIPASVTYIAHHNFERAGLTSATFVDPYGWTASYYGGYGNNNGAISATDLANPATAATYLKNTYLYYNLSKESSQ